MHKKLLDAIQRTSDPKGRRLMLDKAPCRYDGMCEEDRPCKDCILSSLAEAMGGDDE